MRRAGASRFLRPSRTCLLPDRPARPLHARRPPLCPSVSATTGSGSAAASRRVAWVWRESCMSKAFLLASEPKKLTMQLTPKVCRWLWVKSPVLRYTPGKVDRWNQAPAPPSRRRSPAQVKTRPPDGGEPVFGELLLTIVNEDADDTLESGFCDFYRQIMR